MIEDSELVLRMNAKQKENKEIQERLKQEVRRIKEEEEK